tara:strand:+ start:156 stop:320 length:165 start_codon:yes stop_codon:yes gene_type:complete
MDHKSPFEACAERSGSRVLGGCKINAVKKSPLFEEGVGGDVFIGVNPYIYKNFL